MKWCFGGDGGMMGGFGVAAGRSDPLVSSY